MLDVAIAGARAPRSPPQDAGWVEPEGPGGFGWTMLPRHGRRPLGFRGRILVQVACRQPDLSVWSDLALHETDGGVLVAAVRHVMRDGTAPPRCYAEASRDPAALRDLLLAHDPLADLTAEALLGDGGDGAAAAAAIQAGLLRQAWRALLAATFGGPGTAAVQA